MTDTPEAVAHARKLLGACPDGWAVSVEEVLDALVAENARLAAELAEALLNARDQADIRRRSDAEVRARAMAAERERDEALRQRDGAVECLTTFASERDDALRVADQLRAASAEIAAIVRPLPGVNPKYDTCIGMVEAVRAALSSEGQPRECVTDHRNTGFRDSLA